MKKNEVIVFLSFLFLFGCQSNDQKEPTKLLSKDQMVNVIYDLALLEALRTQNMGRISYPSPSEFVKKKYKIDSLGLVENTKYYASDIKEYKKMYAEAKKKLDDETLKISNAIKSRSPKNNLPNAEVSEEEGVVN